MRIFREWIQRLHGTLLPGRRDADLEYELRSHLEMATDDARRRGLDPDDASRAARIVAGGASQAMDALRDQRGLPWVDDLARDVLDLAIAGLQSGIALRSRAVPDPCLLEDSDTESNSTHS